MNLSDGNGVLLALDFGLKQIGVAVGNNVTRTAQSLTTLRARDGAPDWAELEQIMQEWQPGQICVGLPLNMDGSESELSQRARRFANRIHGRFGVTIEMVDERLSSVAAKENLKEQGHRGDYLKHPADAEAARLILETWFSER